MMTNKNNILNLYEKQEYDNWSQTQNKQNKQFKLVKINLLCNMFIYLIIFIIEYILAIKSKSEVLKADAYNNLSGIISTLLLFIGIHIASDQDEIRLIGFPVSDQNKIDNQKRIRLSRYRFETIFTLVTSILMIEIALKILTSGIQELLNIKRQNIPNSIGIIGAIISIFLILVIYVFNYYNGKRYQSPSLIAAAQDSLGDILISFGTAISILIMWKLHIKWIGSITTLIIGGYIIFSGFKIFLESSLNLVGYFNPKKEKSYIKTILNNKEIKSVEGIYTYYNGNLITVEVEVTVSKFMTIEESFILSEKIEAELNKRYHVSDTKIIFYPERITMD